MKGHTYKRCPCGSVRDGRGQRITCPKRHGSWYYVHELPPAADGKRRQVSRGGFPTERDARRALHVALEELQRGSYVEVSRLRVGDYLDEWLAGKGRLRAGTRRSYGEHIELYFKPGLGHLRLSDLRHVDVERLYAAMRPLGPGLDAAAAFDDVRRLLAARASGGVSRPLSDARIRRVHATLMSALNSAVRRSLLKDNPARHIELASGRRPRAVVWTPDRVTAWQADGVRPAVAVWTPEQAGAFLDAAAGDRMYALFHLIAFRGLRRGEAVGLRWQDVDLNRSSLRVTQQVMQLGWATEVGEPKTDSGARTVTLDALTVEALRAWRDEQAAERATWGSAWQHTGLVFTREDGSGVHPDLATDTFQRIARTAGLPPIRHA